MIKTIKSIKSGLGAGLLVAALALGLGNIAWAAVEVNQATAAELDSIKGIGPSTSKRILDERSAKGPFKDWQDFITRVKGVGAKNAAKFSQEGLTVNNSPAPADWAVAAKPAQNDATAKAADSTKAAKPADASKAVGKTASDAAPKK